MRTFVVGCFLALITALPGQPATAQDAVEVKVIKYPDLGAAIKALSGKVVVVDFWSTT